MLAKGLAQPRGYGCFDAIVLLGVYQSKLVALSAQVEDGRHRDGVAAAHIGDDIAAELWQVGAVALQACQRLAKCCHGLGEAVAEIENTIGKYCFQRIRCRCHGGLSVSISKATICRFSRENSTPIRRIGLPAARYFSA